MSCLFLSLLTDILIESLNLFHDYLMINLFKKKNDSVREY